MKYNWFDGVLYHDSNLFIASISDLGDAIVLPAYTVGIHDEVSL